MGKINTTDASGNKIDVNDMLIQQGFAKHFGE
jgi:endonuclease YncB( thermonuclease family)